MVNKDEMKRHLEGLGYVVIIDSDDIRIYSKQSNMTLAVFNTRHGEITYTKYFNSLLHFTQKSSLFVELDSFQDEYKQNE